ncbi:MAG TPA: peptidoglycan editing factor PgeF [Nitrospirales bacterium]|nr:peptidoglycan editing factor PgeF [Nitrospirales bacterium]
MSSALEAIITVPLFAKGLVGVSHFFGTKIAPDLPGSGRNGPSLRVVTVRQVHGTEVLVLDRRSGRSFIAGGGESSTDARGYDAIVTNQSGVLVAVETADCVPILLLDPVRGVSAAVHAGWRGTLGGIVPKTVAVMQNRFGCSLRSIRAAIGPSIGVCCYEVNGTVLAPLKRSFPYWAEVVEDVKGTKAHLDLRGLNRRQLEEVGIGLTRVETVNLCTACHPDLFYSYRRDSAGTGRMISGIGFTVMQS